MATTQLAAAQERRTAVGSLGGVVRDTGGQPLSLVLVTVALDSPRTALTDSAGAFRLPNLPAGVHRVSFRRIGYAAAAFDLAVPPGGGPPVTVELAAVSLQLDTITVLGRVISTGLERVGFYDRQRQAREGAGVGTFLTPEDVAARGMLPQTTHLLESAGVRMLQTQQTLWPVGRAYVILDGTRGRIQTGPCQMAVFIDGMEVDIGTYWGSRGGPSSNPGPGLDALIHPGDIKAIEVYHSGSGTPVQFQSTRRAACGSIVIWTKAN